ncbi:MAG: hypothetical protein ACJ790_10090 [Myxococcaceae bacterium]
MNRRTISVAVIAIGVLALIILTRMRPELDPARPRKMTDEQKSLLVTLKDVKPLIPATKDTDPEAEEFRLDAREGRAVDAAYEFSAKSGDVSIGSFAEFLPNVELAKARYAEKQSELKELRRRFSLSDKPCTGPQWGEEDECVDLIRDGDKAIVGRMFLARKNDRVYQLELYGILFDSEKQFADLLLPHLLRFSTIDAPN